MKRAIFLILAMSILFGLSGCGISQVRSQSPGPCPTCALPGNCATCPEACQPCVACDPSCPPGVFDPGPPTGAVTYPYYTVRGPRDFLARNPQPIGP